MPLPIAICTPEDSVQGDAWMVLILVVAAYFGLLVVALRGVPREARLRVAGTWIVSAIAVTAVAWSFEESGGYTGAAFIAGLGVAGVVAILGVTLRKSERAWPYVVAGSLGGVTPVALVVALFAWFFANGGCLG